MRLSRYCLEQNQGAVLVSDSPVLFAPPASSDSLRSVTAPAGFRRHADTQGLTGGKFPSACSYNNPHINARNHPLPPPQQRLEPLRPHPTTHIPHRHRSGSRGVRYRRLQSWYVTTGLSEDARRRRRAIRYRAHRRTRQRADRRVCEVEEEAFHPLCLPFPLRTRMTYSRRVQPRHEPPPPPHPRWHPRWRGAPQTPHPRAATAPSTLARKQNHQQERAVHAGAVEEVGYE